MQNLVFSILLGLIWLNIGRDWDDNPSNMGLSQALLGILFFMTINQAFGSVFGVIFLYPLERSVVLRERASGTYRVLPYHISKIVSELPRTLFFTMEFALIVYWMVGLKATVGAFFLWWFLTILTVLITESMALCVSTMLPNPQTASAVMPVFIILAMLFSGFFISVDTIPSYIAWGQCMSCCVVARRLLAASLVVWIGFSRMLPLFFCVCLNCFVETRDVDRTPSLTQRYLPLLVRTLDLHRPLLPSADLSYIKYAFAAVAQNQFQGTPEGEAVLDSAGLNSISLGANIAILIGFYFFWRTLLYVILRFDKPKFDRKI